MSSTTSSTMSPTAPAQPLSPTTSPTLSLFRDTTRPTPEMLARIDAINAADPAAPIQWLPHRLIVQNYWQFDYQEFYFVTGRCVFNGPNGTGKSSVEAAAIPVALDMNKHRKRFDPFGGSEKSAAYYLLGLPDAKPGSAFYHDDRTAYVVWEFRHGATGEFATVGIGLRAKRSDGPDPKLESWGLAVRGKRVGIDFELSTRDARGREFPITKVELARAIGAAHVFGHNNREYQAAVNELLFGFESLDEFLYLTDTLVALRAPKLDRGLSPEKLSGQMRDALPSLSPDLMGRLSTLIKRIDSAMDALAMTRDHVAAVQKIHEAQGDYANQLAQQAAVMVLEQESKLAGVRRAHTAADESLRQTRATHQKVSASIDSCDSELRSTQGAYDVQVNSDAYKTIASQEAAERELTTLEEAAREATSEVTRAMERVEDQRAAVDAIRQEWFDTVAEIESDGDAAAGLATTARWDAADIRIQAALGAIARGSVDVEPEPAEDPALVLDSVVIGTMGLERMAQCTAVVAAIDAVAKATTACDEAEHKQQLASEELRLADDAVRTQTAALNTARDAAAAHVEAWATTAPFPVPDAVRETVSAAIDAYAGPGTATTVLAAVTTAGREAIAVAKQRADVAHHESIALGVERAQRERERQAWESKRWDTPAPRPGQDAARKALAEAGIMALPLYATCDFQARVPVGEQVAIEAALEEMGLLDALIVPRTAHAAVRALIARGALGPDAGDRWLLTDSGHAPAAAGKSLADLLTPATDAIESDDVRAALALVHVGVPTEATPREKHDDAAVAQDGRWHHGLLVGQAAPRGETAPRFIGEANRQRRREEELRRLAEALDTLDTRISTLTQERDAAMTLQTTIATALTTLADADAISALANVAGDLATARRAAQRANERVTAALRALEAAQAERRRATAAYEKAVLRLDVTRGLSRDQVVALRGDTQRCLDAVRALERSFAAFPKLRTRVQKQKQAVADASADVDTREIRAQDARARAHEAESRLGTIRELLTGKDQAAIKQEVERLRGRITELQTELGPLRERRGSLTQSIAGLEQKVNDLSDDLVRTEGAQRAAAREFEQALMKYAEPDLLRALEKFQAPDGGPHAAADDLLRHRRTDREKLSAAVADRFNRVVSTLARIFEEQRLTLGAYRPELLDNWATFVSTDGQRVAVDVFLQRLRDIETEQQRAVSEAENDLYVNFFLGDVINAIRKKVLEAQAFATRIDDILANMRISNGLQFSLTWKPRKVVGANGVDYHKLVDFVELDPDAVTTEKRDEMLREFRARVDVVRTTAMRGNEGAYGELLHQEFDYRNWFEFRFFFQKPDEPKLELRDRTIEQLSGGERTLAQQLPLLAAVHARSLATPRPDAPKLIAWDEAFVGVDAANADEVFKILTELNFSFLFTGNALWGQSRYLPGCATYSLRASGGVVFPMLSVWDGRRRITEADAERDARAAYATPHQAAHANTASSATTRV